MFQILAFVLGHLGKQNCFYEVIFCSGKDSSEQEKTESVKAAEEYLDSDPSERDSSTPIYKIQQGQEPLSFKGFFMVTF